MKRWLVTLAVLLVGAAAYAQPFVWPNAWSADAEEARSGGSLRVYSVSDPRTFNPFVSAEQNALIDIADLLGAALLTRGPDSDEWLPYAAESFEVSEDGLVIDVVLRDGIMWSDGTPVTVQDYFFRYQAETDPEVQSNAYDSYFIGDEQITLEITGEREMRWTFPEVDRLAFFTLATARPAPDHILGEIYREGGAEALRGAWGTEVDPTTTVWTGPWVPTSFSPGERLLMVRNPYFGEWNVDEAGTPLPYLDEYNIAIVESSDTALNLYIAGQLDIFAPGTLDDIGVINNAIQTGDIDATVIENASPAATSQFIVFNWNRASNPFQEELFRSVEFRQAMSHLVDRDAIVDLVYGGAAEPMWSSVYQVLTDWVNPDVPRFEYNPEAALDLLANIGFTETNSDGWLVDAEGNVLGFTLVTNAGNTEREQIAQIFADAAREVGVRVEVNPIDFNLMVDQLFSTGDDRPFEAILIGLRGGSRDWPHGDNVDRCEGNLHMFNTSGECISTGELLVDELVVQGRRLLDNDEARAVSYEIQRIQAEEQSLIYTVSEVAHYSWLNTVGGEHPEEFINAIAGSRQPVLTFKYE